MTWSYRPRSVEEEELLQGLAEDAKVVYGDVRGARTMVLAQLVKYALEALRRGDLEMPFRARGDPHAVPPATAGPAAAGDQTSQRGPSRRAGGGRGGGTS